MENASSEAGPSTSAAAAAGGGDGSAGANPVDGDSFYNTGRVGRRNAMADILSSHCTTSTADLPDQLGALSTSDTPKKTTNSSNTTMDTNEPSTSQQTPNTTAS